MKKMLLIAAVAAVAGCADTRGTRVMLDAETGDASVLENSYRLSNRVKVRKVTYGDNGDGIKWATMTIESTTRRRQRLQARIVWMDAEGTEIDPDGKPYRTYVIDGNDVLTVSGMAPSAKGVAAKVQIREIIDVE